MICLILYQFNLPSLLQFFSFLLFSLVVSVSFQTMQLVEAVVPKAQFAMTCGYCNQQLRVWGSCTPQRVQSRPGPRWRSWSKGPETLGIFHFKIQKTALKLVCFLCISFNIIKAFRIKLTTFQGRFVCFWQR